METIRTAWLRNLRQILAAISGISTDSASPVSEAIGIIAKPQSRRLHSPRVPHPVAFSRYELPFSELISQKDEEAGFRGIVHVGGPPAPFREQGIDGLPVARCHGFAWKETVALGGHRTGRRIS